MLDKHEASFRIYDYDKTTFEIKNYQQYISDLKKTIIVDKIIYNKSYSFNEEYNVSGVNLNSYLEIYNKIKDNNTAVISRYYTNINPGVLPKQCAESCRESILQDILPNV